MSRHEGVSCDSCMKANFRGRRYKCLICYDYDLCATCYEAGITTTRHLSSHAMQCILTRSDCELYYGGEGLTVEQPQSFSCPYCSKMGFNERTLQEHVTSDHSDSSSEVICPICAALPGGDPNHVTEDFLSHLTQEHREMREFQEEPISGIRHVRRIPHPGRGMGGARSRRTFNFQSSTGLPPSARETPMDPIAELLSQLSTVRSRAAQSVTSQLQQLEMQLQSTRQQLEGIPKQRVESVKPVTSQTTTILDLPTNMQAIVPHKNTQYLLARLGENEATEYEKQTNEVESADQSLFVQEILLSTLSEGLRLENDFAWPSGNNSEKIMFYSKSHKNNALASDEVFIRNAETSQNSYNESEEDESSITIVNNCSSYDSSSDAKSTPNIAVRNNKNSLNSSKKVISPCWPPSSH